MASPSAIQLNPIATEVGKIVVPGTDLTVIDDLIAAVGNILLNSSTGRPHDQVPRNHHGGGAPDHWRTRTR